MMIDWYAMFDFKGGCVHQREQCIQCQRNTTQNNVLTHIGQRSRVIPMTTNLADIFPWVLHSNIVYVQIVESLNLVFIPTVHISVASDGGFCVRPRGGPSTRGVRLEDLGVAPGGVVVPPGEGIGGRHALYCAVEAHRPALVADDVLRVIQHRYLAHLVCCKRTSQKINCLRVSHATSSSGPLGDLRLVSWKSIFTS